ncbi:hypothetical protein NDU88_004912 [Pleurodeles waltl]|uniref:Uncharacterized protein n=1 Tax=Pleurodeles waltl TaxID=8319 RepID=A0AAV7WW45_PLEWA|nr:hypothetical protein NDU88_004912 [Pleurodeles waltl]
MDKRVMISRRSKCTGPSWARVEDLLGIMLVDYDEDGLEEGYVREVGERELLQADKRGQLMLCLMCCRKKRSIQCGRRGTGAHGEVAYKCTGRSLKSDMVAAAQSPMARQQAPVQTPTLDPVKGQDAGVGPEMLSTGLDPGGARGEWGSSCAKICYAAWNQEIINNEKPEGKQIAHTLADIFGAAGDTAAPLDA